MTAGPDKNATIATPAARRPLPSWLWVLLLILGIAAAIRAGLELPGLPYNVRELFPSNLRILRILAFATLLVWLGLAPALGARLIAPSTRRILLLPAIAVLVGAGSWALLQFAVTMESRHDILGAPRLGWPWRWESLCRFLALQGILTLPLVAAHVTAIAFAAAGRKRALARGVAATAWSMPWLVLCWLVVIAWARTDNITELVRSRPYPWLGPAFLTALAFLIAVAAAALAYRPARRADAVASPSRRPAGNGTPAAPRRILCRVAIVIFCLLLVLPGWWLLWQGLESQVHKYGLVFPAARFLLGPDRKTALSHADLFARWCTIQWGLMFLLGSAGRLATGISRGARGGR